MEFLENTSESSNSLINTNATQKKNKAFSDPSWTSEAINSLWMELEEEAIPGVQRLRSKTRGCRRATCWTTSLESQPFEEKENYTRVIFSRTESCWKKKGWYLWMYSWHQEMKPWYVMNTHLSSTLFWICVLLLWNASNDSLVVWESVWTNTGWIEAIVPKVVNRDSDFQRKWKLNEN